MTKHKRPEDASRKKQDQARSEEDDRDTAMGPPVSENADQDSGLPHDEGREDRQSRERTEEGAPG